MPGDGHLPPGRSSRRMGLLHRAKRRVLQKVGRALRTSFFVGCASAHHLGAQKMKLFLSFICSLTLATGILLAADTKDASKKPTTQPATQPAKAVNKFCAVEQDQEIDPKI